MKLSKRHRKMLRNWERPLLALSALLLFVAVVTFAIFSPPVLRLAHSRPASGDAWLEYWGAFISMAASSAVAIVSLNQARIYNAREDERRARERFWDVQPIFSVEISKKDTLLPHAAGTFDHETSREVSAHENVQLDIENAGSYPITNVRIYGIYLSACLRPGDCIHVAVMFPDSPDVKALDERYGEQPFFDIEGEKAIVIGRLEGQSGVKNSKGYPSALDIRYQDADLHQRTQRFFLSRTGATPHYEGGKKIY